MNKYQTCFDRLITNNYLTGREKREYIKIIQELVNKETPMKVKNRETLCYVYNEPHYYGLCPRCNGALKNNGVIYCPVCGQKVDWSD